MGRESHRTPGFGVDIVIHGACKGCGEPFKPSHELMQDLADLSTRVVEEHERSCLGLRWGLGDDGKPCLEPAPVRELTGGGEGGSLRCQLPRGHRWPRHVAMPGGGGVAVGWYDNRVKQPAECFHAAEELASDSGDHDDEGIPRCRKSCPVRCSPGGRPSCHLLPSHAGEHEGAAGGVLLRWQTHEVLRR